MKIRVIALACVLVMAVSMLAGCGSVKAKEFSKAGMSITLTTAFTEKEMATQTAYYESQKAIVTCLKEEFSILEDEGLSADDVTLEQYGEAVIVMNGLDSEVQTEDGLTYIRYDKSLNGKDFSYYATVFKGTDAFWMIQFACESKNFDSMHEIFKTWAKSVKFS